MVLLPFTPQPRPRWRSQTSHKDYATPKSICFSNETSMSPRMGRRFQIQHSLGCSLSFLSHAGAWHGLLTTPCSHPGTVGNGMDCQACQESHSACTPQAHAPKGVCSHAAEQGLTRSHSSHPPVIWKLSPEQGGKKGGKSSQKCLCCGNVNNANISAFKYVWNDKECQHVPRLPRNSFESLLP